MTPRLEEILLYRIVPLSNLPNLFENGLYSKKANRNDLGFETIGNQDIINQRDTTNVKCFPGLCVNDFIPFYFSIRTPMLFNIITGRGVQLKRQEEITYLVCRLEDIINENLQWCFTDGNAAKRISKFYNTIENIDKLDWTSIKSNDFGINNMDGDSDRIRKKHAEFLIRGHLPIRLIMGIGVFNEEIKIQVENWANQYNLDMSVKVKKNYYFE